MTVQIGIDATAKKARMKKLVDAERDRRIAETFTFAGHAFQFDEASKMRVTGAATLAGFAVASGALSGNYRWNGGAVDFTWLSSANVNVPLDAPTMFAMGQAAAEHERALIFAARVLKDMTPIPDDFADNSHWT